MKALTPENRMQLFCATLQGVIIAAASDAKDQKVGPIVKRTMEIFREAKGVYERDPAS